MERTPTNSKPWVHIEALNFEGMAASAILSIRQNQKGMAGTTGLEPAASAVTGQRSNQLNYVPTRQRGCACSLPERQLSRRQLIYPNSLFRIGKLQARKT
jgi:hypothetical protein